MDKAQAFHNYVSSFSLPTYDENTVPENAAIPRLTYSFVFSSWGENVAMSLSLWYYSKSWEEISQKADEIYNNIGLGGVMIPFDGGAIWIRRGNPFAQRVSDENDNIRRILINIEAEFISA